MNTRALSGAIAVLFVTLFFPFNAMAENSFDKMVGKRVYVYPQKGEHQHFARTGFDPGFGVITSYKPNGLGRLDYLVKVKLDSSQEVEAQYSQTVPPEDLEAARKLVGRAIYYINPPYRIHTEDGKGYFESSRNQRFFVTKVEMLGPTDFDTPDIFQYKSGFIRLHLKNGNIRLIDDVFMDANRVLNADEGFNTNYVFRVRYSTTDLKQLFSKFGKRFSDLVAQGKIAIGMTPEMAKAAWGEPEKVNTSVGSWGVNEQWVYGIGSYLYFENGKLTSWQN